MPIKDEAYKGYVDLLGKPKTRGRRAGVYIFTHIPSGNMYVGSSNSLSRRLNQYFYKNHSFN